MFGFVNTLFNDLHPIVVHFPVALFTLSFLLVFAGRIWPQVRQTEWLLFVLGAITALVAVITGLIAHQPYETTGLNTVIEPHQLSAMFGTVLIIALVVWRGLSRRRGRDIGQKGWYVAIAVLGLVWIFVVGGTGGQLVYEYAVNVRGVNPLLP